MTRREDDGRRELKYCVPERLATDVLVIARHYLVPEPLARGPEQRVTSLYLDTPDLTFLRWHRERADERYKVRIRAYGDPPAPTLYRELKSKCGDVVRKVRNAFPAAMRDVVIGECRSRYSATPQVLVSVMRESLRHPAQPTAVTVDRMLRYQAMTEADLAGDAHGWSPLPLPPCAGAAPVLLELKFGATVPAWMQTLSEQLAPWRVSFSKYATAMACAYEPAAASLRAVDTSARQADLLHAIVSPSAPVMGSAV